MKVKLGDKVPFSAIKVGHAFLREANSTLYKKTSTALTWNAVNVKSNQYSFMIDVDESVYPLIKDGWRND